MWSFVLKRADGSCVRFHPKGNTKTVDLEQRNNISWVEQWNNMKQRNNKTRVEQSGFVRVVQILVDLA